MTDVPPSDAPLSDAPAPDTAPADALPGEAGPGDAVSGDALPAGTELTYEAAAARVEEIIRRLDSGGASLNETLELVREGKTLIELCARELAAVGDALEELRLDDLVSRLEQEGSQ
jgi:exodeoxyribonuclease VII small subunit